MVIVNIEGKNIEFKEELFVKIKDIPNYLNKEVYIRGWVHRERGSNERKFILLRDSSGIVQCLIERKDFDDRKFKQADKIEVETSMILRGVVIKDDRAPGGYEIHVKDFWVVGESHLFPIGKDLSEEFLLDNRHLWLRSRRMIAILKIRSTVFGAIHEFFRNRGFYEFHSPIFQSLQCEGGATLFSVDYFGNKDVFLAQTWQLFAEPAIFALERIYTIAPSFRAEKFKTSRHLAEFWHAEMEVAWANFKDIIDYGEELVKFIVKKVINENKDELKILKRDINKLIPTIEKPFPRITYDEALKLLKKHFNMDIEWGKDLRTIEEDKLSELFDTPIIITRYPKKVKAFYMKEPEDSDPKKPVVNGADFIAPEHYGEIIGGSERETDLEKLKQNLIEIGEDLEQYKFYLDTRKYGSVPHGGFGMGIERLVSWICGLKTIREAIPFPRTLRRYKP